MRVEVYGSQSMYSFVGACMVNRETAGGVLGEIEPGGGPLLQDSNTFCRASFS